MSMGILRPVLKNNAGKHNEHVLFWRGEIAL